MKKSVAKHTQRLIFLRQKVKQAAEKFIKQTDNLLTCRLSVGYNILRGEIHMVDGKELRRRVESRIAELPPGYISKKNIKGKIQYYRQWRENGKLKSKYIRADDVESIRKQIEERKALQERLKELQLRYPNEGENIVYETKIVYGDDLRQMIETIKGFKKRDCFGRIEKFLHGTDRTRVCALYGLRRTGKTTLLLQTIAEMSEEEFGKCFYAKMNTENTMAQITRDLDKMFDNGYRYAFIDEVTLMKDFIDSAALFSDIYSMMGMKIVLSGKDSLGFWLARDNELYDRVRMIHTTFIPFREYSRLLGIDSIDEYIRYGGLLSQGELDFENEDVIADDASFRDDESTRKYVDTAISRNIQHSLACCRYGHRFGPLRELYEADELTSAINRIVEDMNHRFLVSVLTRDFVSSDLGITAHNLKNERDLQKRTNILEAIDKKTVTEKLMKLLNIRNKAEQTVEITPSQAARIKEYLKGLDLIVECPVRNAEMGLEKEERILFTQPGMRYCQAQALVYSLMQDETFGQLTEDEKTFITDRILEEVRGRMLEDIVLLETMKALGRNYDVFKYQFATGEYDMLIYGRNERGCAAYEIKHSDKCVSEQSRHLRNENMLSLTTPRFGTLEGRYVLYLGENKDTEDGIAYRNAEQFLKALPEISLTSGLEETESEDETEGMQPTM